MLARGAQVCWLRRRLVHQVRTLPPADRTELHRRLAADPSPHVRRFAARLLGSLENPTTEIVPVAAPPGRGDEVSAA
jgi:hypothetical protein